MFTFQFFTGIDTRHVIKIIAKTPDIAFDKAERDMMALDGRNLRLI